MERRKFISNIIKTAALPLILPACNMFSQSSNSSIKHVVYCIFAGGVRNFESFEKREGNLMPNLLSGTESISEDIKEAIEKMPRVFNTPLQKQGTFYNNFRYNSSETIHYSAHAAAITGNYHGNFQIMKPLTVPTIFELIRKHGDSKSALKTWWVTDQGGPFPFLNYSNHQDYGPLYGANMIHPQALSKLNLEKLDFFSNETFTKVSEYKKAMLNLGAVKETFPYQNGIINSDEDRFEINQFLKKLGQEVFSRDLGNLWDLKGKANHDILNMYAACEVLKTFQPELLVVNMQDSDIGHSNFSQMCNNLHKADFALAKLWETIQQIPSMKDNTVLIAAPEFGRNLNNNTIVDPYGRFAVDHTGDENSKNIFCSVLGPSGVIKQNNIVNSTKAETIDIVPTIAHLLNLHDKIPSKFINGKILEDALV
jgi:hypothetical protein